MQMGDGGFRPAYNVQLATTADAARVIVGVQVNQPGQRRRTEHADDRTDRATYRPETRGLPGDLLRARDVVDEPFAVPGTGFHRADANSGLGDAFHHAVTRGNDPEIGH
jgi:predicted acylesterase/phospholipase RssA